MSEEYTIVREFIRPDGVVFRREKLGLWRTRSRAEGIVQELRAKAPAYLRFSVEAK